MSTTHVNTEHHTHTHTKKLRDNTRKEEEEIFKAWENEEFLKISETTGFFSFYIFLYIMFSFYLSVYKFPMSACVCVCVNADIPPF